MRGASSGKQQQGPDECTRSPWQQTIQPCVFFMLNATCRMFLRTKAAHEPLLHTVLADHSQSGLTINLHYGDASHPVFEQTVYATVAPMMLAA